jgi:sugar phosphate isomerase/epimerase
VADAYSIALEAGEGVAVMADFFHMNIEESSIPNALKSAFSRLVHVHLADSNRREPGKGHTDFGTPLKLLETLNYSHYGALECSLSGEPVESLRQALGYLKGSVQKG